MCLRIPLYIYIRLGGSSTVFQKSQNRWTKKIYNIEVNLKSVRFTSDLPMDSANTNYSIIGVLLCWSCYLQFKITGLMTASCLVMIVSAVSDEISSVQTEVSQIKTVLEKSGKNNNILGLDVLR